MVRPLNDMQQGKGLETLGMLDQEHVVVHSHVRQVDLAVASLCSRVFLAQHVDFAVALLGPRVFSAQHVVLVAQLVPVQVHLL